MLAAIVAATTVLGGSVTYEGGCAIGEFTTRIVFNEAYEKCCNPSDTTSCYAGPDPCKVSHQFHCCIQGSAATPSGPGVFCNDACGGAGENYCPPPAEPASEELSSGAIGGIVVGAYLGAAAIGGAAAAYRGVV